jgi:hypothetical protein
MPLFKMPDCLADLVFFTQNRNAARANMGAFGAQSIWVFINDLGALELNYRIPAHYR